MKVLILILRTNNILHFSPQEHYFDCPYQLSSETVSQTYLDAMVSSLEVIEGDIIVMVLMALSTMFVIMGLFPQYANIEMLVMLVSYLFLSSFTGFELRVALRIGSWNTGPRLLSYHGGKRSLACNKHGRPLFCSCFDISLSFS
ncbi:unnamed protein product [Linum tenue]|uniref:Uncharacterized protein n=1 Tax=Linum tenue TaxID=586396 RepID=A0AAV0H9C3_9ROSI|nr:unnamed protein product [Linum tenue]